MREENPSSIPMDSSFYKLHPEEEFPCNLSYKYHLGLVYSTTNIGSLGHKKNLLDLYCNPFINIFHINFSNNSEILLDATCTEVSKKAHIQDLNGPSRA